MTGAARQVKPVRVLMCRPIHYQVRYAINPWMIGSQVDRARATDQFNELVAVYGECGVHTALVDQHPQLPDMVFTANAGLMLEKVFIPSNFRYAERTPEAELFADYFSSMGVNVELINPEILFEGAGDALFCGSHLFLGYGFRSSIEVKSAIAPWVPNHDVVSLGLSNPYFYHLDTCLSPLPSGKFCYYPDAFDDHSRKILEALDGYWVTERFCVQYGCNMVVVNNTIITTWIDDRIRQIADQEALEVRQLDMSEFIKSGGGIRCLSLFY